ncbi:MAG: HPP family protein [bacterium]
MQKSKFLHYLGIDSNPVSHREKIISALGGFIGILCVLFVSSYFVGIEEAIYIVPSMGASAVLLFAVPHSAFGQLWNVFGGHLISAAIGVLCSQLILIDSIAAASAVGLAILAMYYARCIHPPGGATALAAVIGGPQIHALGYQYILTPVAVNAILILVVAFLFNLLFKWRRYPSFLTSIEVKATQTPDDYGPIEHADLVYALSQIDSYIDVTEQDLLQIYKLATGREVNAAIDTGSDSA